MRLKFGRPATWNTWISASRQINFNQKNFAPGILTRDARDGETELNTILRSGPVNVSNSNSSMALYKDVRAGIASHHLLMAPVLMAYYRELAKERPDITTIFILGPDHFRETRARIAVGTEPFIWGKKKVRINKKAARGFMDCLSIDPDPFPFKGEHTILSHIPFISSFFPNTTIVPVIVDINCPPQLYGKAAGFIRTYITRDPGSFILLSIDFSHHLSKEETAQQDACSVSILREMNPAYTRDLTCDSPKSWYIFTNIFSQTGSRMDFLYYTTNEIYLGYPVTDRTSYFFTFLRTPS